MPIVIKRLFSVLIVGSSRTAKWDFAGHSHHWLRFALGTLAVAAAAPAKPNTQVFPSLRLNERESSVRPVFAGAL
jgi:hypothetical protein